MLEYRDVIGVDEAGRGPLFGPVVAACVYILDTDDEIFDKINDSKKLTEKKREQIYKELIVSDKIQYAVGVASSEEIDKINILNATFLAMNRALEKLKITDKKVLVDGNQKIRGYKLEQDFLVKGDSKDLSIATASIIAKVYRDHLLYDYDEKYPLYGFKNHKGYGTKAHYEAIEKYGILKEHRKSFLKKILMK
ncbi:ribonuclease HII [uncultured Sneathia sp.]|uniref:ribonuclease HII n=1 Tax=uncultured Sneathia sp. TaxID=278067 RepID=UPI00259B9831|nr:ribonuclease HII [uncultured Sneathia sp.]